jgi:hypothetical protein
MITRSSDDHDEVDAVAIRSRNLLRTTTANNLEGLRAFYDGFITVFAIGGDSGHYCDIMSRWNSLLLLLQSR